MHAYSSCFSRFCPGAVLSVFAVMIALSFPFLSAPPCFADELENALEDIVKDFERHIGRLDENTKYHIVVRSFIDEHSKKRKKLSIEIENSLIDIIIEKFRFKKNIVVLERERIKTLDDEFAFDTKGELTWDKKMFKKLGAGFIITGSFTKLSKYVKIRATMIDILTGQVIASSNGRVYLDEIDPGLIDDYPSEESGARPSERGPEPVEGQVPRSGAPAAPPAGTYPQYPQSQYPSQPQYPQAPATPQVAAYFCCDGFGNRRCQLYQPVPVGSPCFCIGQGYGVACQ